MDLFETARDPVKALEARASRTGAGLALAFSSYMPLEVLDAFGLEAARLQPVQKPDYPEADAVIQSFVCNCTRSELDAVLGSGLPVDLLATTTGCDARLALSGILDAAYERAPTVMLGLPVAVGGAEAAARAVDAMRAFVDDVAQRLGRGLDEDLLAEAVEKRAEVRSRVAAMFDALPGGGDPLAAYASAVAAHLLEPDLWLGTVAEAGASAAGTGGVPVMLSGSSVPSLKLVEDMVELGAGIVADDTCTATRWAERTVRTGGEGTLLDAVARSLVEREAHGPVVFDRAGDRPGDVARKAAAAGARAVVAVHYKFCDPHSFEIPALKAALDAVEIELVVVQVDRERGLPAREATRIQGMLEGMA